MSDRKNVYGGHSDIWRLSYFLYLEYYQVWKMVLITTIILKGVNENIARVYRGLF